jgi:hypothetical protein
LESNIEIKQLAAEEGLFKGSKLPICRAKKKVVLYPQKKKKVRNVKSDPLS